MIYNAIDASCEYINSKCDVFSEKHAIPFVKNAYEKARPLAAKVAGYWSKSLGEKVYKNWHDPFTSEFVLKITKHVQSLSGLIARSETTKRPYLEYLDRSLTSCAQHLYAHVKEVNYLLSLPKKLREYASSFSIDNFMLQVSEKTGRFFVWVSRAVLIGKYIVLALIDLVIRVVDCVIQFFTFTDKIAVLGYLRDIVRAARDGLHEKFVDIAHRAINKRENHIRKHVTDNVASATTEYIVPILTRSTAKTAIGVVAYLTTATLAQYLNVPPSITRLAGVAVASGLIWQASIKPFLDPYYEAYNPDFKTDSTKLKEFCKDYSLKRFYVPLKILRDFLAASEESTPHPKHIAKDPNKGVGKA